MKFVDLFAGIGGFHYALKKILKNAEPVMVSEIDDNAKKAYSFNHKFKIENIKDIKEYTDGSKKAEINMNNLDDFNILLGGFPCQTFSNAGKKEGFMDKTKGTLFFDLAKILRTKKPKYALLENVKHLSTHDDGKTWITIRDTIRSLGYTVPDQPILLSPHEFGIPQIRWRVFIPAIRKDVARTEEISWDFDELKTDKIKPIKFDQKIDNETVIKDKKILDALLAWGEFIKNVKRPSGRTLPVIWLDHMNNKKTNTIKNFNEMPKWKKKYITDMKRVYNQNTEYIEKWMENHNVNKWQKRERKLEWQAGKTNFNYKKTYVQLRQSGFRFKSPDIFPTLVAMVQTSLIFDKKIGGWRYLSRNEVRKLQSFPKSFKYNVQSYQTYKQFGNSVNVKVVEIVLRRLLRKEMGNNEQTT